MSNNHSNQIKSQTLNSQQIAAIQCTEGPVMIIAGPGSGKTRVITERIAHLIKIGINAENILALTFTNKAAKEMVNRIHDITNNHTTFAIWMGTFHSIFARILRAEAAAIGHTPNFTIYDNEDSVKLVRQIINDFNLDKEFYDAKYIFSRISFMKNNLLGPIKYEKHLELLEEDNRQNKPDFLKIYTKYCMLCRQSNCLDFDDLLIKTNELFSQHPHILQSYQNQFQYILIDEYQDTNKAQDSIIKQIGFKHQNVCVVGDDSQSIYSFRGANINNILNFKKVYTNVKEFKLERNYRSTQNIVNVANSLIAYNKHKIEKTIFSENQVGEKINLIEFNNGREEGEKIALIISNLITTHTKKSDHAILYRTNSQSKMIEDGLRKRGIDYKIFGGLSFYQRKEIKDIMAYLKLIVNHNDTQALIRIINYPTRGIGTTTINKIRDKAEEENKTIWETIDSTHLDNIKITSATKNKILEFKNMLKELFECINHNIFDTIEQVSEKTGIISKLKNDPNPENHNRLENIGELFNSAKLFSMKTNSSLINFINEISLDEQVESKNNKEYISLMTIHQSKGLEYPYVYIVGLENGLFPSQKSMKQQILLEEERRLLYVAITRGAQKVTLSYALNRFRFGSITQAEKSLFLDEMNYLFVKKLRKQKNYNTSKLKTPTINNQRLIKIKKDERGNYRKDIKIGLIITHNIFGKGEIIHIDVSDGNQKITVKFIDYGTKILLTKFAKFKIIT